MEIENKKTLFLLGGYTNKQLMAHFPKGTEGDGIYLVVFDSYLKKFSRLKSSRVCENPAFIMKHPKLELCYFVTEVILG